MDSRDVVKLCTLKSIVLVFSFSMAKWPKVHQTKLLADMGVCQSSEHVMCGIGEGQGNWELCLYYWYKFKQVLNRNWPFGLIGLWPLAGITSNVEAIVPMPENVRMLPTGKWKTTKPATELKYLWVLFTTDGFELDRCFRMASPVILLSYWTLVIKRELSWKVKMMI